MKFFALSLLASVLLFTCGKKVKDNEQSAPPSSTGEIPRWEQVAHKNIKFDYYVTSNDESLQILDQSEDVSAMLPTLKLKGPGDELMDFVMMFQVAAGDVCKGFQANNAFEWKGIVFEQFPSDQVAMFAEKHKITDAGKLISYLFFLVLNNDGSCVRFTFYDINFHAYNHELSVLDSSEMAKTIRMIGRSVVLNSK